jgi:hypothetical protein
MAKPPLTSTAHLLPFERLSPDDFERLSLALVQREGYLRVQHLGRRGDDGGRDVTGHLRTDDGGEELWYFQCKRYQKVNASTLKEEVKKIDELAASDATMQPMGIVFMISSAVNARTRDAIVKHCLGRYKCEVWGDTDLDSRVNRHPELIKQFFGASISLSVVPREIPAPPADFTGREGDIVELLAEIERGSEVAVAGLRGMGGSGKTVIAERVAQLLASRFPDGQLYVDLKGVGDAAVPAFEAQAHVIRAFSQTTQIPERPEGVKGLYLSTLSGKKVLLMADNAADATQIIL